MTKEILANKSAWKILSKNRYKNFKEALQKQDSLLSKLIEEEIGDVSGKSIIHLLCNTGADSISLARKGAIVTGVDIVPENIFYAKKLSYELGIKNIDFVESDVLELKNRHDKKYDMVFATEGVLNWLPELNKWAETVKSLLKENGILYLLDTHPFCLIFDREKLSKDLIEIYFPYFGSEPERFETIGASGEEKKQENFEWMHTMGNIVNSLINAGLSIEHLNEFKDLFYDYGGMEKNKDGTYSHPLYDNKIPFMFSLKARLKH